MTMTETTVLEHARNLLRRDDLMPHDDFFSVGGDSLVGMHLVARVGRELNLPVRVTLLFQYPVLGDFAAAVEGVRDDAAG